MNPWKPYRTLPKDEDITFLVWLSVEHHGSHMHVAKRTASNGLVVVAGLFSWDLEGEPLFWRPSPKEKPEGW
jgi:hypothetical protein